MQVTAAVVREPGGAFELEALELDAPQAGEVLVKIAASGICHTDMHARDRYQPVPFPAVFGHEGGGTVVAVGSAVTKLKPGDPVVLCYPSCGTCPACAARAWTYCATVGPLKHGGARADGSTVFRKGAEVVHGNFFQQSSFATYALATERNAVKVRADAPLELLGAFSCGINTGAGTVMNVLRPAAGTSFALFGAGSVGLAALMAAKLLGCDPLIAVDVRPNRLALARDLGATHTIDATTEDPVARIRALTGSGVAATVEASAVPKALRQAVDSLAPRGTCCLVGSARRGTEAAFEMPFLQQGRTVRGVVQGDSEPDVFIPQLVDLFMAGRFPVDKLVTFYPFADIQRAVADAESGTTIKPVLRMP
ncbi:MAG: NAD(P)-dependent alcohol dehydrogenase [Alphaproteobacteria bacterium]|nr:NAD(P)-dependent alcohol dehydrogenase [Alphaproteobacteria bacterium]